ncbi:alginate lyase family protein [uncultured Caulobacter sp.]|uniref:alginate lyase family protein n=1 Tax=uncultured Caulobacter sp. TaxID=158749 RepID=UPI00262E7435|nr:alginate lyase family protein [uncultured Caulobacter sp.]
MAAAGLIVTASAAQAADYGLLGPGFGKGPIAPASRDSIVSKAAANLDRPPGAIPHAHTEGTLPGKGIREISIKAREDQPIVLNFAIAYRLTGDRRFLAATGRYLENWADIYQISFNPIDETGFDTLIMAYDLTEDDLPAPIRAKLDGFWRKMASGYLDAMDAKPRNFNTNWQSHRVKLATLAAYQTGDAKLIARARQAFRDQIAANLYADGSMFDFHERDALHYVTYDLDPLMMAALAAQAHGEDWFTFKTAAGASLPHSLDWLTAYATGEKTHIEFANSKIQFDRDRAASGQAEYAPHNWDVSNAVGTYALASLLDPKYGALGDDLVKRTGKKPAPWIEILRASPPR